MCVCVREREREEREKERERLWYEKTVMMAAEKGAFVCMREQK